MTMKLNEELHSCGACITRIGPTESIKRWGTVSPYVINQETCVEVKVTMIRPKCVNGLSRRGASSRRIAV